MAPMGGSLPHCAPVGVASCQGRGSCPSGDFLVTCRQGRPGASSSLWALLSTRVYMHTSTQTLPPAVWVHTVDGSVRAHATAKTERFQIQAHILPMAPMHQEGDGGLAATCGLGRVPASRKCRGAPCLLKANSAPTH